VDTSILNFLKKFQENVLLEDVNLHVDYKYMRYKEDILLQVLTQIVPLISSIDSILIYSSEIDLFKMVYNNTNNGDKKTHQLMLMEMMAKTRIVVINWLYFNIYLFYSYILYN
jgi:hypothetical protein